MHVCACVYVWISIVGVDICMWTQHNNVWMHVYGYGCECTNVCKYNYECPCSETMTCSTTVHNISPEAWMAKWRILHLFIRYCPKNWGGRTIFGDLGTAKELLLKYYYMSIYMITSVPCRAVRLSVAGCMTRCPRWPCMPQREDALWWRCHIMRSEAEQ